MIDSVQECYSVGEKYQNGSTADRFIDKVERYNCNECKHKFVCLVDPHCDKRFKTRVVEVLPNE